MSIVNTNYSGNVPPNVRSPQPSLGSRRTDNYSLDVFQLVKRKFGLISFFVLLGIGLAVLYYFNAPKTYESTAKIFVDEKNAPALNASNRGSYVDEVSVEKYLETLKSTLILESAVEKGDFENLESFKETRDILFSLREGDAFTVVPADAKSKSGVIRLAFRSGSKEECAKVLQEIISSFDNYLKSTTKLVGGENADLVQRAQDLWLARLQEVEKSIEKLMVDPELLNVDGRAINPYQMQLSLMHKELHDLRSRRNKLAARVENVKLDQAAGRDSIDLISDIMTVDSESSDNSSRTKFQLVQLKIEEQALLNEYAEDHPEIRAIRRKIEMVEQLQLQELVSSPRASGGSGKPDLIKDFYRQMDRRMDMLAAEERQVAGQIESIQAKSKSVAALVEKLNTLQRERSRLEVGYATVIEKMSEVDALKEHLWRNLAVLDPPSLAETVAPKLPTCLTAGLFLGGLLGLGFASFKDIAEMTFRSSDAVGEALQTRVVGHVSLFDKLRARKRNVKFPNVQAEVITIHAPASQASEAYRAIRTSIFFKARETSAKIIQITSPTPGDGKSTTASNLATTIAQSGSRVLLLDADMRKPTQQNLFGLENNQGLSSVIAGEADPNEIVQNVLPGYLSVVTSGPIPANPAELLTSARFAAVLEEYRDSYDYILIDTPPMLAVTDPSIVCTHADLVYLVMKIRNGVRTNSVRAKEIIDSMGIELGGVIINGLRRRDQKAYAYSGQYGYGSYSYGQTAQASRQVSRQKVPR
jgi:capsular exopolysaccharide synthesis family protein